MATANTGTGGNLTREDYKKMKELEELRKSGAAMPELDDEGNMINPHIPQYIRQVPWYYNSSAATMKHQSGASFQERQADVAAMDEDKRVVKRANMSGSKFRKGACENCGSMTHKKRDCLEKPRAKNAKLLNTTFGADEISNNDVKLSFEAKNDQFRNYDIRNYDKVHEYYQKLEETRAVAAKERLSEATAKIIEDNQDLDTDDEQDFTAPSSSTGGSTVQHGQNIRVREDLPKYLRNLDVNSAHYDPKARSMRENPYAPNDPRAQLYAGDNQLRAGGMHSEVNRLNQFAWEMHEKAGLESNAIAQPSEIEYKYKEFLKKKEESEQMKKAMMQSRYGTGKAVTVASEYEGANQQTDAFTSLGSALTSKVHVETDAHAPQVLLEESGHDNISKRKRDEEE